MSFGKGKNDGNEEENHEEKSSSQGETRTAQSQWSIQETQIRGTSWIVSKNRQPGPVSVR